MATFLAHALILLAAWTVTIKFLFPIVFAAFEGSPLLSHVYWDFWWVAHLWLAWALLRWPPYTAALAIGVSVVEIAIILTKFAFFLAAPEWTIWTTNWFVNKLFVLACFCLMLPYFLLHRRPRRARSGLPAEEGISD
ncbi:MAG TPA: hypothetical protein VLE23_09095 [Geminicoccaceae bacterium]|nr:hypothetical protein [Geminicoccaceae bacterium]